ncbi:hypothetical protein SRHO_G00114260 [Serrasalmus rhombeus]
MTCKGLAKPRVCPVTPQGHQANDPAPKMTPLTTADTVGATTSQSRQQQAQLNQSLRASPPCSLNPSLSLSQVGAGAVEKAWRWRAYAGRLTK